MGRTSNDRAGASERQQGRVPIAFGSRRPFAQAGRTCADVQPATGDRDRQPFGAAAGGERRCSLSVVDERLPNLPRIVPPEQAVRRSPVVSLPAPNRSLALNVEAEVVKRPAAV